VKNFLSSSEAFKNDNTRRISRRIEEQVNKSHEKSNVVSLMKSLDLNISYTDKRSPLEQFETSYSAFESTVDSSTPAITSLIPMRECILQTIAALLAKRKYQEKAGKPKDKVVSILNQLKRDSVSFDLIRDLSMKSEDILHKHLSSSKQQKISRSEWQNMLMLATLWLKSFLSAIDPAKVKTRPT
jgi:hypothetical protein